MFIFFSWKLNENVLKPFNFSFLVGFVDRPSLPNRFRTRINYSRAITDGTRGLSLTAKSLTEDFQVKRGFNFFGEPIKVYHPFHLEVVLMVFIVTVLEAVPKKNDADSRERVVSKLTGQMEAVAIGSVVDVERIVLVSLDLSIVKVCAMNGLVFVCLVVVTEVVEDEEIKGYNVYFKKVFLEPNGLDADVCIILHLEKQTVFTFNVELLVYSLSAVDDFMLKLVEVLKVSLKDNFGFD